MDTIIRKSIMFGGALFLLDWASFFLTNFNLYTILLSNFLLLLIELDSSKIYIRVLSALIVMVFLSLIISHTYLVS